MVEIKMAKEMAEVVLSEGKSKSFEITPLRARMSVLATDVLEKEGLFTREIKTQESEKLKEIRSWIKEVNPNYSPFTPYGSNCGTCAWVVHNRLQGAKDIVAGRINIAPQDADMEELTGMKCKYMSPTDIENILRSRGPDSELIVGINRTEGAGHWFNVFYDGNEFYTIDGQCGEVMEWPHDYGNIAEWCALV